MSAAHLPHSLRRAVWSGLCAALGTLPAAAMPDAAPGVPEGAASVVPVEAVGSAISPEYEPAPELFEATATALWDGGRTLQGVWVAHPLAGPAGRVRIYNTETDAAVDGVLYKADSTVAGQPMPVSSEAAQALGMAPGDEVGIRIVALSPLQGPETAPEARPQAATVPASGEDAPEAIAPAGPAEAEPADTGRLQPTPPAAPVEADTAPPRVMVRGASDDTGAAGAERPKRRGVFRRPPAPDPRTEPSPAEPAPARAAPAPPRR